MATDNAPETKVVATLDTHKLEGKRVPKPSINLQGLRVATKDEIREEAAEEPRPYLISEQKRRDPNTGFGELEIKLGSIKSGKREIGSLKEDVKSARELIDNLPGGDDRETKRDLRRYVTDMLIQVFDKEFHGNVADFKNTWVHLGGGLARRLLARTRYPQLATVFSYFTAHEANLNAIDIDQVLDFVQAIKSIRGGNKVDRDILRRIADRSTPIAGKGTEAAQKEAIYQKLLAKEGYAGASPAKPAREWGQEKKEDAYLIFFGLRERETAINPAEFWEKELLGVVETRLEGMQGKFSIVPKDADKWNWDEEKMFFDDNHSGAKGFSDKEFKVSLLTSPEFTDFRESDNEIAKFLQKMGRAEHWEGKRRLDIAFWSKLLGMGPTIEGETNRIYQELDSANINDSNIGYYTGAEAWEMWRQDKELATAYDAIFAYQKHDYTNDGTIYYKPLDLDEVVPALQRSGTSDQKIMEAIMLSQVYCADMVYNTSSKNRIFTTQMAVVYYRRAQVTDSQGRVIDLLSPGFGLTDTIANKMYLLDARNDRITYAAYNNDRHEWNPKKHPEQVEMKWKTAHFPIVIAGMVIFGARFEAAGPDYWLNPNKVFPDDIALPGDVGDFMSFDNNRSHPNQQIKKDNSVVLFNPKSELADENRFYLHRHALFKLFSGLLDRQRVAEEHDSSILGWKDPIEFRYGNSLVATTIKKDVQEIVNFFKDTAEIDADIDNPRIQRLLKRVLPNPMAWGHMLSLQDGRTMEMMRERADLRHGFEYEVKSKESWKKLGKVLGKLQHSKMLEDIEITPADFIAAFEDMHHRFRDNQIWMQADAPIEFATIAFLSRLQKTFPSQEQIDQAIHQAMIMWIDERGYVQLIHDPGGKEREKLLERAEKDFGELGGRSTLIGQTLLQNALFIKSTAESHLRLIEMGFQDMADHGLYAWLDKLRTVRVLNWGHPREMVWQKHAFMWCLLGTRAQEGKLLEYFQTLDVVWEKDPATGQFKAVPTDSHQIAIQDITDGEKEEFFYEMGRDDNLDPRLAEVYEQHGIYVEKLDPATGRVGRQTGKVWNSQVKEGDSERTYLVFKSVEHRERFYERRTRFAINLFYGMGEGSTVELDKYFEPDEKGNPKKAYDSQLIRQVQELNEMVIAVNRVNAYYDVEHIFLDAAIEGADITVALKKAESHLHSKETSEDLREKDVEIILETLRSNLEYDRLTWPAKTSNFLGGKVGKLLSWVPFAGALLGELTPAQVLIGIGVPAYLALATSGKILVDALTFAISKIPTGLASTIGLGGLASTLSWVVIIGGSFLIANQVSSRLRRYATTSKKTAIRPRMLLHDDNGRELPEDHPLRKKHEKLMNPLPFQFTRVN